MMTFALLIGCRDFDASTYKEITWVNLTLFLAYEFPSSLLLSMHGGFIYLIVCRWLRVDAITVNIFKLIS